MLSIYSSHLILNIGLLETGFPHPARETSGPNHEREFETSKGSYHLFLWGSVLVRWRGEKPKGLVEIQSFSVNLEDGSGKHFKDS